VDDVLGIADAVGALPFHIVAHDWGGMVAWALATSHPQRLKSLTGLSTPQFSRTCGLMIDLASQPT
jgi:pimeloyl-ACP methyl ester carboxylesterase